jgi:hypothetical protein
LHQRTKMHAEHVLHFLSCKPAENLFCSDDEERTCGEWRASAAHDRNERHMVVVELIKKRFTRRERAPFERERDRTTIARARQPVLHDRENATLKPSSNFYHSIPPSCQELEPLSSPVHKVVSFKSPPQKNFLSLKVQTRIRSRGLLTRARTTLPPQRDTQTVHRFLPSYTHSSWPAWCGDI